MWNDRDTEANAAQGELRIILNAFINSVERLEEVLEHETILLKQHKPIALYDFNHKKSHGLLEFSRAMIALRALDPAAADSTANAPLIRLRSKLNENLTILQTHLEAVGAVAASIARAIQEHDSDGTYSQSINTNGRQR
ncbi:hypothetical protein SAMN05444581_101472 [Methylocapsa palsarum]|uniref:FlgN protein n=2 Tax=Methylocapsa palsarum TaxID=1612308 RepID=A0A1I3WBK0_9HYPH|nr:hypothetical protein SAMN05444581_101472 [Methylocapsa palsarum]